MVTAIAYQSSFGGHVRAVAEHIASAIGADAVDLGKDGSLDLSGYDTVVFGTGVHAGRPYKKVTRFIEAHKAELESKKTVLFVCCMYNDDKGERQCKAIAGKYGISESVFFCDDTIDKATGIPSGVSGLIERLKL